MNISYKHHVFGIDDTVSIHITPNGITCTFPFTQPTGRYSFIIRSVGCIFICYINPVQLISKTGTETLSFRKSTYFNIFSQFRVKNDSAAGTILICAIIG